MKHLVHSILSLFPLFIVKSQKVEVKVKEGIILGIRQSTVFEENVYFAFYGVPYARIPVGKLRFKDPKPLKKWKKPYDAQVEYHGACAQVHIVHKHALYGNENCLKLNIYTPVLPKNGYGNLKTVIVWIHGYAFATSFSHLHGPDFLIDNDVLFISITHRIGVFGFIKIKEDDSNANMGLKDIVMALKWIRRNVKQFGGDKNKITIMGSGSAGTFISLLMTSKHKNLFAKAILQSGSLFSPSIFQGDHNAERERLINKVKDMGIASLVNISSKHIALISQKIYTNKEIINFQKPVVPFTPIIENRSNWSIITEFSHDMYNKIRRINFRIPMLIGFNSQESISDVIPFVHNTSYLRKLDRRFLYMVPFTDGCKFNNTSALYTEVAAKIKEKYFKWGLSKHSVHDFLQYATDLHIYPIYKFIQSYLGVQKKLYVYKFNYVGNFNAVKATSLAGSSATVKGAAEGDEICYILRCEPLWENYVKLKSDLRNRDRIFIKHIAEMWANFAKFDDPIHVNNGNFTWPPMTENDDNIFVFGKENKLFNTKAEMSMYRFWNTIYSRYYTKKHCENIHDEL